MTQARYDSSKKKKVSRSITPSLPLFNARLKAKEAEGASASKHIFQLKAELNRYQQRDREWRLLFGMLAHDLKEPLLTLEGFTKLLQESEPQNKEQKKYMKVIREAVGSLHLLIGSLQSITRLSQETSDLTDLSLLQVLDSVLTSLSEQLKRSRGKIILPEGDAIIKADPARIYQIFLNLISNSLKYHHADRAPEIKIRYRKDPTYHRISIQDNGIGIQPKDIERIFTAFTRLEDAASEGLGLGLSIVKRIAESCGGFVNVRSNQNIGTTFTVYLPRSGVS